MAANLPCMTRWLRLAGALLLRSIQDPRVGLSLLRVGWRFRHRGWYQRPPFLPLPDRNYMRWRMYTAFGDSNALPSPDDAVRFARWATRRR